MPDIHSKIMNMQINTTNLIEAVKEYMKYWSASDIAHSSYIRGFQDARHAAAELALKDKDDA